MCSPWNEGLLVEVAGSGETGSPTPEAEGRHRHRWPSPEASPPKGLARPPQG